MRGGAASIMIVLALGMSGMMLGASGFEDAWGADPPKTSAAEEKLNDSASDMNPQDSPVSGPVSSGDSEVVGLIASGLGTLVSLAGSVVFLPMTLTSLFFPAWFAEPAGLLAQIVVVISIIQYATNRVFE